VLAGEKRGVQIEVEIALPIAKAVFIDAPHREATHQVDQHVHAPEVPDQTFDCRFIAQIDVDEAQAVKLCSAEVFLKALYLSFAAVSNSSGFCPLCHQRRNAKAETAGATSYQDMLTLHC